MNADEKEPLQRKLERELQESEWLNKFKRLSDLLMRLKTEMPLTQLCKLEWKTESDTLLIRCPNPEVQRDLLAQATAIAQRSPEAERVILQYANQQEILKQPAK